MLWTSLDPKQTTAINAGHTHTCIAGVVMMPGCNHLLPACLPREKSPPENPPTVNATALPMPGGSITRLPHKRWPLLQLLVLLQAQRAWQRWQLGSQLVSQRPVLHPCSSYAATTHPQAVVGGVPTATAAHVVLPGPTPRHLPLYKWQKEHPAACPGFRAVTVCPHMPCMVAWAACCAGW